MDFILNGLTDFLNASAAVLGGWSFTRNLAEDINKINPYLQKANMIIPIVSAMTVFGLWVGLQLVLIAYYWVTRAINLLRGAG